MKFIFFLLHLHPVLVNEYHAYFLTSDLPIALSDLFMEVVDRCESCKLFEDNLTLPKYSLPSVLWYGEILLLMCHVEVTILLSKYRIYGRVMLPIETQRQNRVLSAVGLGVYDAGAVCIVDMGCLLAKWF